MTVDEHATKPHSMIFHNKHVPVLFEETLHALEPCLSAGVVVDCTLGGAGHTSGLLNRNPQSKVLSCDVDATAIDAARTRLKSFIDQGRLAFFHGNFSKLPEATQLATGFQSPWQGILMDLGYSSNQLEDPDYGMSFMIDGPLDMRLTRGSDKTSTLTDTAWDILTQSTTQELGDILKAYGEILGAHKLAQKIQTGISENKIKNSTASLARFLEWAAGKKSKDAIHPATLVFQALRIAVNDELRVLDQFLESAILKLNVGGRFAIITFHSLEDRVVKRWGVRNAQHLNAMTKKPVLAGETEIAANPRARSAKLRVYERI